MKKRIKSKIVTWGVILIIFIGALVYISSKKHPETTEEIAKCIGKNSVLYTQLGCHACKIQENIFGENYQYLNVIDCWFEQDKCGDVTATPTWKIKGSFYKGVQSIDKLKELTGC